MARQRKERPARPPKAPKAPAPRKVAPEVKELEDAGGGMTVDDGITLATTFLLAVAVVLVIMANGTYS